MHRHKDPTRSDHEFSANCRRAVRFTVLAALAAWASGSLSGQTSAANTGSVPHAPLAADPVSPAFDPQQRIAQQSRALLQLAEQLKSEMDESRMDVLSLDIVRTATAIENLARGVKDKIKHSPGAR